MKPIIRRALCNLALGSTFSTAIFSPHTVAALAQAPAPASRQLGTVKTISGGTFTLSTDAGQPITVTVADTARILQLAPGSTDLKTAQTITLTDIGIGDRILVTGKAGDTPETFAATRVILMKSGDIAEKHAAEQADWKLRGVGGIVSTVEPSGIVNISSGAKKTAVQTTPRTIFRRYAPDSVKFEAAKPGTLAQIQPGDQFEVRGAKSEDGTSIQAEEIVSGSFRNLSGTLAGVNAPAGTVTLKDLSTKKTVTVSITANSDVRKLPPEIATRFAARERGTGANAPGSGNPPAPSGASTANRPSAGHPPASTPVTVPDGQVKPGGPPPSGQYTGPFAGGPAPGTGRPGGAGMDLSKMLSRLPPATISDLHTGDAVMIVASQPAVGGDAVTAVTVLSGVEPILAATPAGGQAMTLSPWSVGSGSPEGGGGPQ